MPTISRNPHRSSLIKMFLRKLLSVKWFEYMTYGQQYISVVVSNSKAPYESDFKRLPWSRHKTQSSGHMIKQQCRFTIVLVNKLALTLSQAPSFGYTSTFSL